MSAQDGRGGPQETVAQPPDEQAETNAPPPPLPPPLRKARPRAATEAQGLAPDARLYEDLGVETTGENSLSLGAHWLYKVRDAVFGPISSKALLEKLYAGEIDAETPIAPQDGGEFLALRRYGAFRAHLPKVKEHQGALAEVKAKEQEVARVHRRHRVTYAVIAAVVVAGVAGATLHFVRKQRAEEQAAIKEKQIREDLEAMLASVTIEPPLVDIAGEDEQQEPEKQGEKPKKGRAVARFSGRRSGGPINPNAELSREEIMGGVAGVFGEFKGCIITQMRADRDSVPERVVLTFSINNDGVVQNADIEDRALRRSQLKDCLIQKLTSVRFRRFKGEVQNVEYPITIGRPS